jgi:hypothetical protein
MASLAQLNANRLNAQRSTGPRTDAGKAATRFNALKHGIEARSLVIPGEDPAELEALALDYRTQFHPEGPLELFLVDTLIRADWERRRYTRVEGIILQSSPDGSSHAAELVFRRLAYAERLYFRSLTELRRAQKERRLEEEEAGEAGDGTTPAPSPQPLAPVSPPEIGFVPPVPLPAATEAGPSPLSVGQRLRQEVVNP